MIKFGAESEFLEEFLPGEPGWTFAQPKVADFSGRRPLVFVSNTREFTEPANENAPFPAGKVPVALNGRIEVPNEVDAYVIEVEPGSRITFDLLAWRIGSPLDGKIVLKNEQGQVLAQNDDREGAEDPLLNYNVPGNLKKLIVEVSDVAAGGSKSDIYRLDIYRQDRPDIVATVPVDTLNIPKNGTGFLPVRVQRNNHSGPIDLVFHGLPNTYQVSGNRIEADSNVGLVTITAKDPSPAFFSIEARCQAGDLIRSQDVFAPETEFARGQSVWRKRIAVATEESRSLAVQWNLVDNTPVFLGSKFNTEVTLRTSEPSPGPVRIRVVTNQEVHRKLVRKNNKSTFVPDLESAIRAADVELKPEQMKGSLQITIPVNIAEKTWQALVVAELLSADRKRVLATTATQPITLTTRSPGSVTIREGKILTLPTKGKINHRIQGDIKRTQPGTRCRISLAGLPKGVVVKPVVVADDTDKFDVSFEIPVNAELLKLKKLGVRFEFLGDDAKDQVLGQAKPASLKIKKAPEEKKPPKS